MLLTISPAKEAQKSPSKLRRKFATNFAEIFANFALEIAGAYTIGVEIMAKLIRQTILLWYVIDDTH